MNGRSLVMAAWTAPGEWGHTLARTGEDGLWACAHGAVERSKRMLQIGRKRGIDGQNQQRPMIESSAEHSCHSQTPAHAQSSSSSACTTDVPAAPPTLPPSPHPAPMGSTPTRTATANEPPPFGAARPDVRGVGGANNSHPAIKQKAGECWDELADGNAG